MADKEEIKTLEELEEKGRSFDLRVLQLHYR